MSVAWQLRLKGHEVTVYESDEEVGGKLRQVIPEERLPRQVLQREIERIKEIGIELRTSTPVDQKVFKSLRADYNAVVIASGAHTPVVIPFKGHERVRQGLTFLKAINRGERPSVGKKVVVVGAGNAGMDVGLGAYSMGAEEVTAVDIQRPGAYLNEIDNFQKLGGKIEWPFLTEKVDERGIYSKDGHFIEADDILFAVGERPDLSYVPRSWLDDRGMAAIDACRQLQAAPGVFAGG